MCNGRQARLLVMRKAIVAMLVMRAVMQPVIVEMLVMRAVMQPVEDELADDDGWLERVIREGCPFLWGWRGYSSGGRGGSAGEGGFCWGGREISVGREGMSVWRREMSVWRREMSVGKISVPRICAGRVSGRGSWGVRGKKGV